ncbi:elongation factor P hydroxylase [Phytohalomonas tamaricis]|uniref:elongation factor P hydroxylase n=1 Tax=Phytohalomonas tamaricis TaxID=2081032 RepID=UPI000D0ACA26|nr:elongation factor P hydroxylase [Phytohalomonas tamaricis]
MEHRHQDLITLFDGLFKQRYRTRLVLGDNEPLYRPATRPDETHQIIFAHGFFASALHEVSHWCVAGARRRELEDYGYWYLPDGRDADQQRAFESAEVVPQAIEMLLSEACAFRFNVSVDNLNGEVEVDREAFAAKVSAQAERYRREGLAVRAETFRRALEAFYQHGASFSEAITLAGAWHDEQHAHKKPEKRRKTSA